MRTAYHAFPVKRGDHINLCFLGDIHLGASGCLLEEAKEVVRWIAKDPKTYWVGMGDYADSIVYTDAKRYDPATVQVLEDDIWKKRKHTPKQKLERRFCSIDNQIDAFVDLVWPIREKCLGLLEGNHEYEIARRGQTDPLQRILYKLNDPKGERPLDIPDMGYEGCLGLSLQRGRASQLLRVYLHHGAGHGASAVRKLELMSRDTFADMYVMGHVHRKNMSDEERWVFPFNNRRKELQARRRTVHYVITGTFLTKSVPNGPITYGQRAAYHLPGVGSPYVQIRYNENGNRDATDGILQIQKIIPWR